MASQVKYWFGLEYAVSFIPYVLQPRDLMIISVYVSCMDRFFCAALIFFPCGGLDGFFFFRHTFNVFAGNREVFLYSLLAYLIN